MAEEFGCFDSFIDDDFFFDFDPSVVSETPPTEDFIQSSLDSRSSWIEEIESQLMNDDDNHEQQSLLELAQPSVSELLADILVDYPTTDSDPVDLTAAKVSDVSTVDALAAGSNFATGKEKPDFSVEKKSDASNDSGSENQDGTKVESDIEGNDDAMAKKRRRRVRNRDAAVRSRERKKEYITDLEKKSKYLERECLRLGRMLECFVAENQSLRLHLQKDVSKTKQESAVLLLELLLLGSLLWFLGNIICKFPYHHLHTESWFQLLEDRETEKSVLRSGRESSKLSGNTGKSRRCKGSRPRMKHQVCILLV